MPELLFYVQLCFNLYNTEFNEFDSYIIFTLQFPLYSALANYI